MLARDVGNHVLVLVPVPTIFTVQMIHYNSSYHCQYPNLKIHPKLYVMFITYISFWPSKQCKSIFLLGLTLVSTSSNKVSYEM